MHKVTQNKANLQLYLIVWETVSENIYSIFCVLMLPFTYTETPKSVLNINIQTEENLFHCFKMHSVYHNTYIGFTATKHQISA